MLSPRAGPWAPPLAHQARMKMDPQKQSEPEEGLTADVIHLNGGTIGAISADAVQIQRGGATRIVATDVELRQGAMGVRATQVGLAGGGAGMVMGEQVGLDNSRVGLTLARRADLTNSNTFILLAREVNGPVETVLDTRGAVAAGLVAGIAIGLVLFVGGG